MSIHPAAIVDKNATLDSGVSVGPFTVIGPKVTIGKDTEIAGHVTVVGNTTIGERNRIYPYAFIGTDPQDINYNGEDTRLVVGDENIIREYVTMSVATTKHEWVTRVGSRNMLMSYCHVAHDCEIGDGVVFANCLHMGGHVRIEDGAVIGGIVGIHQFVTVGKYAFIGGMSRITQDILPFLISEGNLARPRCINTIGLRRNNFDEARIKALEEAFRMLYNSDAPFSQRLEELESRPDLTDDVRYLIQFSRNTAAGSQGRAREVLRKHARP
jgi:UDP-N-acetylglucosamine acyltransferase